MPPAIAATSAAGIASAGEPVGSLIGEGGEPAS